MDIKEFKKTSTNKINTAINQLFQRIGTEKVYSISIYTSDENSYSYMCLSANTEEGLLEKAKEYSKKENCYHEETGTKLLKWSTPDWKYHNFSKDVASIELPDNNIIQREQKIFRSFVSILKKVKSTNTHLIDSNNIIYSITCGDMSEQFFLKGLKLLNPPSLVNDYIENYTPTPYLKKLESLSGQEQLDTAITLFIELSLGIMTDISIEARSRNVYAWDLEDIISSFGPKSIDKLLDIIEYYGIGNHLNKKGSEASKKHGVFTLEDQLATNSAFAIERCGSISDGQVNRIKEIIKKRVELDKNKKTASTLSENLGRVLHSLRPDEFPESILNSSTNHFDNYVYFI